MNRSTSRPRSRIGAIFLAAITIVLAVLTLLGLEPLALLPGDLGNSVISTSQILVQIVTIVGAAAVIIGVLNLLRVHLYKLPTRQGFYSAITLLTFLAVLGLHAAERLGVLKVTQPATNAPLVTLTMMDAVQVVIESALSGLLFFFLVYTAYRLMRRNVTAWGLLFITALVIVLIGYVQPPGSLLANLRDWLLRVPVTAGTRGLLIGIAIGTVMVGARVLIGQDRLFRE